MAVNITPRSSSEQSRTPLVTWYKQWNAERVLFFVVIGLFLVYGTFRAFENNFYSTMRVFESAARPAGLFANGIVPHYLSPFYSPPIQDWFNLPFNLSPALFLLAFPGSFRFSCYFCRRTYYRAFGSPPGVPPAKSWSSRTTPANANSLCTCRTCTAIRCISF